MIAGATSSGNVIANDYIGTSYVGDKAIPNEADGIDIVGAPANTIGATGGLTVISGNVSNGIEIDGSAATGNSIVDSIVGTGLGTDSTVTNGNDGIDIFDAPLTTIGGLTSAYRNLISGNKGNGLVIAGANAQGNIVEGDYIGTDSRGTTPQPNGGNGVLITSLVNSTIGSGAASHNIIGGSAGHGDLISGNTLSGVVITNAAAINVVENSTIGLNLAGSAALGNGDRGVLINNGATSNTIGGVGVGNVISGNATRLRR